MISVRTMATPKPFTMCQGSPANRSSQSELFFSPPRLPSRSSCASVLNPMVASAQANSNAAAIAVHSENSPQTATGIAISAQGSMPRPNIAPRFTSAGLGASATFGPSIPGTGGNDIAGDCCAAATVACGMTDGGCRMAMRCNAGLMVGSTCVGASAGFHAFWAGSICVDGMDCGITCVPVGIARVPCDCGTGLGIVNRCDHLRCARVGLAGHLFPDYLSCAHIGLPDRLRCFAEPWHRARADGVFAGYVVLQSPQRARIVGRFNKRGHRLRIAIRCATIVGRNPRLRIQRIHGDRLQQIVRRAPLRPIRIKRRTERGHRARRKSRKIGAACRRTFQHGHHRLRAEHRLTRSGERQYARHRPPIGHFIRFRAINDFRRDEPRRAHHQTGTRHMAFAFAHSDAEIHQYRAGARHHHIRRLDIAVHDAGRTRPDAAPSATPSPPCAGARVRSTRRAAAAGNRRRRGNHAKSSSHIDGRHRPAHAIPSPWHPNQAGKSTCSRQPGCLLPDSMRLSRSYFHRTWRADYARELTGWGKRHVPHVEV